MVLRKTVSREQLFSNSQACRTTSRRTTFHQRLARTAQTNLESLLLERLLLHLCVLARAHRRKGSLPRLCGERVLLRVIDTLRRIGFGLPSSNQAQSEYTRSITEHVGTFRKSELDATRSRVEDIVEVDTGSLLGDNPRMRRPPHNWA